VKTEPRSSFKGQVHRASNHKPGKKASPTDRKIKQNWIKVSKYTRGWKCTALARENQKLITRRKGVSTGEKGEKARKKRFEKRKLPEKELIHLFGSRADLIGGAEIRATREK